jgi:hypothetical protein
LISESPADPKADNVAQNCRDSSGGDQKPNIEAMCSGGEKPSPNQSRFGRQRNANAFERDEGCYQPDAVD